MKTLLQKAQAIPVRTRRSSPPTKDEIELAVAWANDEVGLLQVAKAVFGDKARGKGNGVYLLLARSLRAYINPNNI